MFGSYGVEEKAFAATVCNRFAMQCHVVFHLPVQNSHTTRDSRIFEWHDFYAKPVIIGLCTGVGRL